MNSGHARRLIGFSLIELLFTVALLSILLVFGIPSFTRVIASTKLTNATNTLIAHLQYARGEAIKRGTEVSVCPSQDGATCADSADWTHGYLVGEGSGGNLSKVLRSVDDAEMKGIAVTKNGSSKRFQFSADGSATGYQAALKICDPTDDCPVRRIRKVVVSEVGRVTVQCGRPDSQCPIAGECPDTCP